MRSPGARAQRSDPLADPDTGFNPRAKLRFRSSTNVEDSDDFVGAGLYDSISGCLADSLDPRHDGPSACDPNRANHRTVFDAMAKTFASFYNDNAFLERLRHRVPESDVGMALLVHHSFPDEIELANGVATGKTTYILDLEYKKMAPGGQTLPEGGLVVKQVR